MTYAPHSDWTAADDRRLRRAFDAGCSARQIGAHLGLSEHAIGQRLHRLGIPTGPASGASSAVMRARAELLKALWPVPFRRLQRAPSHRLPTPPARPPVSPLSPLLRQENAARHAAWMRAQRDPRPAPWEAPA